MLNVIVLLPADADVDVENPSLMLVVIVPVSLLLNTKLGVVSVDGVVIAVTAANAGSVVSIVTLPVPLVTAEPAFDEVSENAIEYATAPSVSADATVYDAVQESPEV